MTARETLFSATFLMSASPAEVWRHLREPELLHRWFGWHGPEFDSEIAGLSGEFSEVRRDGHDLVIGDHRMALRAAGADTELRLDRTGRSGADDTEIDEGWVTFLEQLRYVIAVRPEGARHTFIVADAPATQIPWKCAEWARSAHQRTVVVPSWGQVQLTVLRPAPDGPDARVVVNGYGRTDRVAEEQHAAVAAWVAHL